MGPLHRPLHTTTHQCTAVGSIRRRSKLASSRGNASATGQGLEPPNESGSNPNQLELDAAGRPRQIRLHKEVFQAVKAPGGSHGALPGSYRQPTACFRVIVSAATFRNATNRTLSTRVISSCPSAVPPAWNCQGDISTLPQGHILALLPKAGGQGAQA